MFIFQGCAHRQRRTMVRTLYFSYLPPFPSSHKQRIVAQLAEPETLDPLSQHSLPFRRSPFSCPWSRRGHPWKRLKKIRKKGDVPVDDQNGGCSILCACVLVNGISKQKKKKKNHTHMSDNDRCCRKMADIADCQCKFMVVVYTLMHTKYHNGSLRTI